MATDLRQLPAYFSNDADFRAWGSGIAAQLAAIGLVQTANTGQINWTTVTKPGAGFTSAGYEIWRFNDALQATLPVFLKVDYCVGSAVTNPSMVLTVGTGTNGAGTITGQVGYGHQPYGTSAKTAGATLPSYCSGSSSRLSLCTNLDASNGAFAMLHLVERTKTAAGVDTANGIVCFSQGATSGGEFQVIPAAGSVPAIGNRNMAVSLAGATSSVGPNVALSPTIAPLGKLFFASWAAYLHADLGELVPVQADHLGASHTMMPLGDGLSQIAPVQGTTTGHSLAILWE
jgi:hypothetical protein